MPPRQHGRHPERPPRTGSLAAGLPGDRDGRGPFENDPGAARPRHRHVDDRRGSRLDRDGRGPGRNDGRRQERPPGPRAHRRRCRLGGLAGHPGAHPDRQRGTRIDRSPTARPGHAARADRCRDPLAAARRVASRGRADRRAQSRVGPRRRSAPLRSPGPARGDHHRPRPRERAARRGDRPAQRRHAHELGSIAQDRRAGPRRRVSPLARGAGRPIVSAHQQGARGVRDDLRPPGTRWRLLRSIQLRRDPTTGRAVASHASTRPRSSVPALACGRGRVSRRPGARGRPSRRDRRSARGGHLGLCRHADPRRGGRGRWRGRVLRSPARRAPHRPRGSRPRRLDRLHGARELPAAGTGDGGRRTVPGDVPGIARSHAPHPARRHARGRKRAGPATVRRRTRVAARPATRGDRRVRRAASAVRARRAAGRGIVQRQRNRDPSRWQSVPGGARDHPVAGGGGATTAGPHPRPDGPAPPPGGDGRSAEDGGGRPPGAGSRSRAQQSAGGDRGLQPAHPRRPVPAARTSGTTRSCWRRKPSGPKTSRGTSWIS